MHTDLIVVVPVYNDWESTAVLMQKMDHLYSKTYRLRYVIVNDSSIQNPDLTLFNNLSSQVTVLELSRNMGHQRAIASGLAFANEHTKAEQVIVMDSDGEDRPEDIQSLINHTTEFKGVVFAKRIKRSEGFFFTFCYVLYKTAFVILTGKKINFGNFCLIPARHLSKLVHVSDIWNHFSGGVIRSGIPYDAVATKRGKRYFGKSKMNFTRLILHGLSAVSVYTDFVSVRLIVFSVLLIILTAFGMGTVVFVKLFTGLAIPGWATFTVLGLGILFLLSLFMSLFLLFNVLSLKTQKSVIPAKDYMDYIVDVKDYMPHCSAAQLSVKTQQKI